MTNVKTGQDTLFTMFGYDGMHYTPDEAFSTLQTMGFFHGEKIQMWPENPVSTPMSEQTVHRLFSAEQDNPSPNTHICILLRGGEDKRMFQEIDPRDTLLMQVHKAVSVLEAPFLPLQYHWTNGVFLSELFEPGARNSSRLADAARYAASVAPRNTLIAPELDPLRACLRYGLLDALCFKDYSQDKPLVIAVDQDGIDLVIPCQPPRFNTIHKVHALSRKAAYGVFLPSACNTPLVERLFCAGVMAKQQVCFDAMKTLWSLLGYTVCPMLLANGFLSLRLHCTK